MDQTTLHLIVGVLNFLATAGGAFVIWWVRQPSPDNKTLGAIHDILKGTVEAKQAQQQPPADKPA